MKILVIDDDPAMTDLLKMILTPTQAKIYCANCGSEGIRMTRIQQPDIILLDLMMPEMDGWQVTEAIRAFTNTPILILSVIDNPGMVARALNEGADDYLVKPVPSGVLIAHINNLTRRQKIEKLDTSPLRVHLQSA